jgi:hypothetical protein
MSYSKEEQTSKAEKKFRTRKCLSCREWFTPEREGEKVCSPECAITHSKNNISKQIKREKAKAKRDFNKNDKSHLLKTAQQIFNKYIRKRDEHLPCISCGENGRQRHAGHYRPVGRNSQHRFNEDNCHAQCSICNNHLSGNLVNYREALIHKIGEKRVITLESQNTPKQWTIEELNQIVETYKQKYKDLL